MSKTKKEMLQEMLRLQLEIDQKVHKEFGVTYMQLIQEGRYFWALLDELGEFYHEEKPYWCWWKKTQEKVDRSRLTEEFADITHFILSYTLAMVDGDLEEAFKLVPFKDRPIDRAKFYVGYCVKKMLDIVYEGDKEKLKDLFEYWEDFSDTYDFDFEKDIYEPYLKKNAVNQKRVEEGY